MKIISKGKPKKERVWRGTCHDCGSVIEAKEGELATHNDQRDGWYCDPVACLVCGKQMHLYPVEKR